MQEQSGMFLGATHLSNNTAEISALGEAYRRLGNQAPLVRQLNVTDITIPVYYTHLTLPTNREV